MKRIFKLFMVVLIGISVINCQKPAANNPGNDTSDPGTNTGDEGDDPDDDAPKDSHLEYTFEYADNTIVMDDNLAGKITQATDAVFTIPRMDSQQEYKQGDVILIPSCGSYPGGFAAKVKSASFVPGDDSGQIYIEKAPLNEVFKNLHFEQTRFNISDYAKEIQTPDGSTIPFTKASGGLAIKLPELLGLTSIGVDIGPNVTITPSMEIVFNMDLNCDIVDCAVTYARMRVDASGKLASDISIKASKDKKWESPLYKIVFAAIPVGPLVITPEVYISFFAKLSGEVNLTVSVSLQKSYSTVVMYDGALHSQSKDTTPKDANSVQVSGNVSGSLEFGPNIGVGLSVYAGAMGIGIDYDPHIVLSTTLSVPFNSQTLSNISNVGYYLANTYFEPSVKYSFGGTLSLAYAYSEHFEVPDEMSLVKSLGKHYFVSSLGKKADVHMADNILKYETHILHKPIFDGQMYIKVFKSGANPDTDYTAVPLTVEDFPAQCEESDSVKCSATYPLDKFAEGEQIKILGPFMKTSIAGIDAEFEMAPKFNYNTLRVVDKKVEQSLRKILADVRKSAQGEWKDCNWDNPDDGLNSWKNVEFRHPDNAEDGTPTYQVTIRLDDNWPVGSSISIPDRSSSLPKGKLKWSLNTYDKGIRTVDSFTVNDPGFQDYFGFDAKNTLSIHSREFTYFVPHSQTQSSCTVDLSGSGLRSVDNRYTGGSNTTYFSGKLIVDNCLDLSSIGLGGAIPKEMSFKNCPLLKEKVINIQNVTDLSPMSNYTGSRVRQLYLSGTTNTQALTLDGNRWPIDRLVVQTQGLTDLTVSNQPDMTEISISHTNFNEAVYPTLVSGLTVKGCNALTQIYALGLASISVEDCAVVEKINADYFSGGSWSGRLNKAFVGGTPKLKTLSLCSSILDGPMPSWLFNLSNTVSTSYPWKYDYETYSDNGTIKYRVKTTRPNGFYYSAEPGKACGHPGRSNRNNGQYSYEYIINHPGEF